MLITIVFSLIALFLFLYSEKEIEKEKTQRKYLVLFSIAFYLLITALGTGTYTLYKTTKNSIFIKNQTILKEQQKRYDIEVIYKDKTREKYTNVKKYYSEDTSVTLILSNDKKIKIYNADIKIIEK